MVWLLGCNDKTHNVVSTSISICALKTATYIQKLPGQLRSVNKLVANYVSLIS